MTLPQRKVRYYEAIALRSEDGDIIPAIDFIDVRKRRPDAEDRQSCGVPLRLGDASPIVEEPRRRAVLQHQRRNLTDAVMFQQFLDFMDANRALASSLMFEFTQEAYRSFGPIEQESLAALAERGFRFSMDHVTDLHITPNELAERAFRFLKVPAKLLLNKVAGVQTDIDPEDLADLLARSGIDLIAERVETETTVVDLLDYDVRFGQGFLFSPPRPVRAEALQGSTSGKSGAAEGEGPGALLAAS